MSKENNEPTFEGCEPSTLFREFAAECMELAQTTPSPEKRIMYLSGDLSSFESGAKAISREGW